MQDSAWSRVASHQILVTAPSPHCHLCESMNISEILIFSFFPDGWYPTLSEFYHWRIRAPACSASIGTWADGRRSKNHSRDEFRCDVSDIGLALVKATCACIEWYIFVFQFPRAFWLQHNCLLYHLTWNPLDSPAKQCPENRNLRLWSLFKRLNATSKSSRDVMRVHGTPKQYQYLNSSERWS